MASVKIIINNANGGFWDLLVPSWGHDFTNVGDGIGILCSCINQFICRGICILGARRIVERGRGRFQINGAGDGASPSACESNSLKCVGRRHFAGGGGGI